MPQNVGLEAAKSWRKLVELRKNVHLHLQRGWWAHTILHLCHITQNHCLHWYPKPCLQSVAMLTVVPVVPQCTPLARSRVGASPTFAHEAANGHQQSGGFGKGRRPEVLHGFWATC